MRPNIVFISEAASISGLAVNTIRVYERDGRFLPRAGTREGRLFWWRKDVEEWKEQR